MLVQQTFVFHLIHLHLFVAFLWEKVIILNWMETIP